MRRPPISTLVPSTTLFRSLCRDLLFGSKLQGALSAAGHDVRPADDAGADVLVVDLTDPDVDGLGAARAATIPTLGFYSHVDQDRKSTRLNSSHANISYADF